MQNIEIAQGVNSIPWCLSKRSKPQQNFLASMDGFCSLFCKERRAQAVSVYEHRRSPDAGLVLSLTSMLFTVLIPYANPNKLPHKIDFFEQKEQGRSVPVRYKRVPKKSNQKRLARMKAVASQSRRQPTV